MRELTKSMLSLSLAVPLFGMKQMLAIGMPRDPSRPFGRAADGFDAVAGAAADQMDGAWKSAFQAGDRMQRGMVDMVLGLVTGDGLDLDRLLRRSAEMMQSTVGAAGALGALRQRLGGCGCGPDAGRGAARLTPFDPPVAPARPAAPAAAAAAGVALSPPAGWTVSIPNV
ncbi:MAG TPA: hypothetical protein VKY89_13725 [Thermoanaerobaculia bacterium]|jgi:hypothetical protein|nr:hypothetical protein [Thermoanaerobaculia bacterium]